jgi:ATP-binding cassette subfamily B protein
MNALKVMWCLIRFTPWLYGFSMLLQIARLSILIVPGLIIQRLFDELAKQTHFTPVFWSLIALLGAVALARVAALLGGIFAEQTAYFTSAALVRTNAFARLLARPDARSLAFPAGDLINRLDKDAGLLALFVAGTNLQVGMAVGALIAVGIMLRIDAFLTLVLLVPFGLVTFLAPLATKYLYTYNRASREADSAANAFLGELFGAAQAIQVAGAEERATQRLGRLNDTRRRAAVRDVLLSHVLITSLVENVAQIGTGIVLLLVGQSLRAGSFTVGDFALFVYVMPRISDFTMWTGRTYAVFRQSEVSLSRLMAAIPHAKPLDLVAPAAVPLHSPAPSVPAAPRSAERFESLDIKQLSYRYPGSEQGIQDVDLQLKRGQFIAVTGEVGSGKTTLLRVLVGALPLQSGEIHWNRRVVDDPAAFFVPPRCAYVAQSPRLFSETLRENLLLGLPEDRQALEWALHEAVFDRDVEALEHGLDTLVGPRGVRLSGGQVQRAAVARMLLRDAELLVFDDVSSALDVETEHLLWERLAHRGDSTLLVVSHRPAVLRRADQIVVLDGGRVVR